MSAGTVSIRGTHNSYKRESLQQVQIDGNISQFQLLF